MSAVAKRWLRLCWGTVRAVLFLGLLVHIGRLWEGLQPQWLGQALTVVNSAAIAIFFADAIRDIDAALGGDEK